MRRELVEYSRLETPDSHFALTAPSSTLFMTPTQAAQMDGVHGGESAQEGCARPGSPLRPSEHPAATAPDVSFTVTGCAIALGDRWNATPSSALRYADTLPCATTTDGTRALPDRRR